LSAPVIKDLKKTLLCELLNRRVFIKLYQIISCNLVAFKQRRIVVTGMGVIAANGQDLSSFWNSVINGVSAARPNTRFDVSSMPTQIGAEIQDFDPQRFTDVKSACRLERDQLYGIAASSLAITDGLDLNRLDPERIGIIEGSSIGGIEAAIKTQETYYKRGYRRTPPMGLVNGYHGAVAGEIAVRFNIQGFAITLSTGSASGSDAIGYALNIMKNDEIDFCLAGGVEAPFFPAVWASLCVNKVMTRRNEFPQEAMRPFDHRRDGMLLGEGAAFLVLEELSSALKRGARIYCEILGYGRSSEAYHPLLPHPDGIGAYRAMSKALYQAKIHLKKLATLMRMVLLRARMMLRKQWLLNVYGAKKLLG
jgi:3-oxoacyl-[acyl-carrier-protein] synthase II